MWKVQLFELNYDNREAQAVQEVLDSGWLTMGQRTLDFEARFSRDAVQGAHCVAVSSGTAALHMALLALDVGPGDEVILPALTFVADINVVKMVGATPVLADSTSLTEWNVSPSDIREKITSNTKAIIAVHYAGYACEMDELLAICRDHDLFLIEDAAHAPLAEYKGRRLGTMGDVGAFSFFTNKNLSVGEGGMFVSNDSSLFQKGKYLRSHGMTTLTLDRFKGRSVTYDVAQIGLNYRIDEMRAALGIVQLGKLPENHARRRHLVGRYHQHFREDPRITPPFTDQYDEINSFHIYPVLLPKSVDRLEVIQFLKDKGIQSSIHYPPMTGFSAYESLKDSPVPIAVEISSRELTLPLHPNMKDSDVDYVAEHLTLACNG